MWLSMYLITFPYSSVFSNGSIVCNPQKQIYNDVVAKSFVVSLTINSGGSMVSSE